MKQPSVVVLNKSCSENKQQIYRRTSMPKCDFIILLVQNQPSRGVLRKRCSNFIKIILRRGCFPVNLLHIFRTLFPKNTPEGLFLSYVYNLGQKIGDKFTKSSKIGFSMECFTADFLQFFTEKGQNLAFGWMAGYLPSNPSISGIFLKFTNFLRF